MRLQTRTLDDDAVLDLTRALLKECGRLRSAAERVTRKALTPRSSSISLTGNAAGWISEGSQTEECVAWLDAARQTVELLLSEAP